MIDPKNCKHIKLNKEVIGHTRDGKFAVRKCASCGDECVELTEKQLKAAERDASNRGRNRGVLDYYLKEANSATQIKELENILKKKL